MDAFSTNLPLQLTSFIGREREIAEVKRLLSSTRLLTLTGAGGAGKTRLALQVASDLLEMYSNGVWVIELASLADPALIPQVIASTFGVREIPNQSFSASLINYLHPKNLLLVLDNCEHLIQACAELSDTLLRGCPSLKILATSREALNITGETSFRVPSLALPDPTQLPPIKTLVQIEAIRLFSERACAVSPDFQITDANQVAIAQVCQRLDGMPLAIELAAARVKMLSAGQIAARLDDRFRLLTSKSRTAPSRQQTLRATLDWSYDLLSEQERVLFRRTAVFAGGFTLEAAEAVCAGEGIESAQVFDRLSDLVDKSLVILGMEQEAKARYRMLETIREYAREKLDESGEARWALNRQLDFFLHLAKEAEPNLVGPDPLKWLQRLDIEYGNLRLALRTAADHRAIDAGLRLVSALERFWEARGFFSEARAFIAVFLASTNKMDSSTQLIRARVFYNAGWLAMLQSDYSTGESLLQESISLCRELGDDTGIARALAPLCFAELNHGNIAVARSLIDKALALLQPQGEKWTLALVLSNLGLVMREQGDYAAARTVMEESLALRRALEDKRAIANSLMDIGATAYAQGDPSAESLLETSLKMREELADQFGIPRCLHDLGAVALSRGDLVRAHARFAKGLEIFRDQGDRRNAIKCVEGLAGVAAANSQVEHAARLLGAAQVAREAIGVPLPVTWRANYDRALFVVRERLDDATLASTWAEGRAMTLEQAIEYALQSELALEEPAKMPPPTNSIGLTEREIEVLQWLARGLSNQEIADKLVLSRRTVHSHLRSIFGKLDVKTRTAATRAAIENKIV